MKKILLTLFTFHISHLAFAQKDTLTTQEQMYNRPFITIGKTSTAVGGYVEGNTNYFAEDGVSEGFSMELRRFNIFLYSTIGHRIKFLSEIEFEHGTEEIKIETAQIDFEFNSALVFRAGIILVPIGSFNQNHDSPKWDFIERPLVSTQIIPSTLSEIGFGFNGKMAGSNLTFTYDAYLVNGLRDEIILNSEGRTFLQSGKSEEMFGEDNNGTPMLTGKIAVNHRKLGELGISYYGGIYNTFKKDGFVVAEKRNLSIMAVDFSTQIYKLKLLGELAMNSIGVPNDIVEIYGTKQWGGFAELNYPFLRRSIFGFEKSVLNAALRLETIDYNVGTFSSTNEKIYDEVKALAFGISWRPTASTVLRANYRYHWVRDLFGNPAIRSAGFQFGVASYF